MFTNHFLKYVLVIGMILLSLLNPTYALAASVSDCFDGSTDCPDLEENSDEQLDIPKEKPKNETGSLIINFLKTGLALILILALIYGLVKLLGKRNQLFQQNRTLENLGGITIGQNKSIQMVRVGKKVYLIGVGENIELLDEITDETLKQELLHRDTNDQQGQQMFTSLLNRFQRPNKRAKNNNEKFKHLFSDELNKLKENRGKAINTHDKKEDHYE